MYVFWGDRGILGGVLRENKYRTMRTPGGEGSARATRGTRTHKHTQKTLGTLVFLFVLVHLPRDLFFGWFL